MYLYVYIFLQSLRSFQPWFSQIFFIILLDSDDINTVFLAFIPEVSEIILFFSLFSFFVQIYDILLFWNQVHWFHLDIMVNIFNPTIQEEETSGSLWDQSQTGLQCETLSQHIKQVHRFHSSLQLYSEAHPMSSHFLLYISVTKIANFFI